MWQVNVAVSWLGVKVRTSGSGPYQCNRTLLWLAKQHPTSKSERERESKSHPSPTCVSLHFFSACSLCHPPQPCQHGPQRWDAAPQCRGQVSLPGSLATPAYIKVALTWTGGAWFTTHAICRTQRLAGKALISQDKWGKTE